MRMLVRMVCYGVLLMAQSGCANPTLRELATKRGLLIGAAAATTPMKRHATSGEETDFTRTLAVQFNILTPENATKFGNLSTGPGAYDWTTADAMFDFAQKHGMKVRFHTGLWHQQIPKWLDESKYSAEQIRQIAKDHIFAVGRRYGDRMHCWDVVNEPISDKSAETGPLRDTIWQRAMGEDYLAMVHRWAHEAAPRAKLVLNEYGTDIANPKSDALYAVVKDLVNRGVPIHAVGFQMHLLNNERYAPEQMTTNLQRFADLGLDVHITEMDVAIAPIPGTMEQKLAVQAETYRRTLEAAMRVERFTVFQTWGFTDAYSWVPNFTKKEDGALIFDAAYQPKPAYFQLIEALQAN